MVLAAQAYANDNRSILPKEDSSVKENILLSESTLAKNMAKKIW